MMIKKIVMSLVASIGIVVAGGNITPVAPINDGKTGFYIGGFTGSVWNYKKGDYEFSDDTKNSKVDGIIGFDVGYNVYSYQAFDFDVEARLAATYNANDPDTTIYSVYLKPVYNVNDKVGVYGLLGGSHVRYNVGRKSNSQNGFSWGLGAKYALTPNVEAFADYTSAIWNKDVGRKKDFNTDAFVVGLNYKF